MSDDSDHEVVAFIKRYGPETQTIDEIAGGFARLNDIQRTEVLQRVDAWVGEPTTLKKQSQLIELRRKMGTVHRGLRMLNR